MSIFVLICYKLKHKCCDRIIAQTLQKVEDFGSFLKHFSSANANGNFSTTPKTIMLVNLPNNKELCDYTGFIVTPNSVMVLNKGQLKANILNDESRWINLTNGDKIKWLLVESKKLENQSKLLWHVGCDGQALNDSGEAFETLKQFLQQQFGSFKI